MILLKLFFELLEILPSFLYNSLLKKEVLIKIRYSNLSDIAFLDTLASKRYALGHNEFSNLMDQLGRPWYGSQYTLERYRNHCRGSTDIASHDAFWPADRVAKLRHIKLSFSARGL